MTRVEKVEIATTQQMIIENAYPHIHDYNSFNSIDGLYGLILAGYAIEEAAKGRYRQGPKPTDEWCNGAQIVSKYHLGCKQEGALFNPGYEQMRKDRFYEALELAKPVRAAWCLQGLDFARGVATGGIWLQSATLLESKSVA